MSQFLGTHLSRRDAKGRVSVPASFRAALKNGGDDNTVQLILRPSHQHPCIEAWPVSVFESLANPLDHMNLFSPEQEDLAAILYADAFPVESDKEGRIVLTENLVTHAGLQDSVTFMGLGRTFQLWEPSAAEHRRQAARDRARERGFTLPGGSAQ
ncbi:MAG TPA: division/cell wall cluster transcriptional repressor MraZ [Acetobacteraceae bacterium]|jgi:MraZ protein